MGRALLLSVAGAVSIGCGNLLGLNGLTYEEEADSTPAANELPIDGDGSPTDTVEPFAPRRFEWQPGAVVIASTNRSFAFHVYHPASGDVVSYQLDQAEPVLSTKNWVPDWSHVVEQPSGPEPGDRTALLGYRSGEKQTAEDWQSRGFPAGSPTEPANSNWSTLIGFWHQGASQLLAYDRSEGDYRIGNGASKLGLWEKGFTEILACHDAGRAILLKWRATDGRLELMDIVSLPSDEPSDQPPQLTFRTEATWPEWTTLACVNAPDQPLMLVRYDARLGRVERGTVQHADPPGMGGSSPDGAFHFDVLEEAALPEDYVSLTVVSLPSGIHLLGHDPVAGIAGLFSLDWSSFPSVVK